MRFYSFIDHGARSNSLLKNASLLKDYFAEFENVFMCLITYFFAATKLFQKPSIFKTERSNSKI